MTFFLRRKKTGSNKFGTAPPKERTRLGVLYDSKLEMKYAAKLELLRHAIRDDYRVVNVERQVSIKLEVNDNLICIYRVDFRVTYADGRIEYQEVKGMDTPEWKLKEKLFRALYPHQTLRVIRKV